jgi:hypothetical protein
LTETLQEAERNLTETREKPDRKPERNLADT